MKTASTASAALLCARTNCDNSSRKKSPYCSDVCVRRKGTPKRIAKVISKSSKCKHCSKPIPSTKVYCDSSCLSAYRRSKRIDTMYRSPFIMWVISSGVVRAGTVEILPTSYNEWLDLHSLWKLSRSYDGQLVEANGRVTRNGLYVLCHLAAAKPKGQNYLGKLVADNLVIGLSSLNQSDGNRKSVHTGEVVYKDKLKDKWKVNLPIDLNDHESIFQLIRAFSPSLDTLLSDKVTKVNRKTNEPYEVYRVAPKVSKSPRKWNGKEWVHPRTGSVYEDYRTEPADMEQVLQSEFSRMGHDLSQFDRGDGYYRHHDAFEHLMRTAKVVNSLDEDPIDLLSFDYDYESITEVL